MLTLGSMNLFISFVFSSLSCLCNWSFFLYFLPYSFFFSLDMLG